MFKRLKSAHTNKCAILGKRTCVVSFFRGCEDKALICTVTENCILAALKPEEHLLSNKILRIRNTADKNDVLC